MPFKSSLPFRGFRLEFYISTNCMGAIVYIHPSILFYSITVILFVEQHKLWRSSLCNFAILPLLHLCFLHPNILLSTLFQSRSVCVKNQVSHDTKHTFLTQKKTQWIRTENFRPAQGNESYTFRIMKRMPSLTDHNPLFHSLMCYKSYYCLTLSNVLKQKKSSETFHLICVRIRSQMNQIYREFGHVNSNGLKSLAFLQDSTYPDVA
jgi:hypothetical protein